MTIWRFSKRDIAPALLLLLLPLAAALPQLSGWLEANPLLYVGAMTEELRAGPIRGAPNIDPNSGFGTQALGYRAAADWLRGQVPWWNPYSGVGLPLAAEYQGAPFFPADLPDAPAARIGVDAGRAPDRERPGDLRAPAPARPESHRRHGGRPGVCVQRHARVVLPRARLHRFHSFPGCCSGSSAHGRAPRWGCAADGGRSPCRWRCRW